MTDSLTIDLLEAVQAWGLGGGGDDDHDELLHAFIVWFDAGGSVSQVEQLLTIGQAVPELRERLAEKVEALRTLADSAEEVSNYEEGLRLAFKANGVHLAVSFVDDLLRGSVQEGKT